MSLHHYFLQFMLRTAFWSLLSNSAKCLGKAVFALFPAASPPQRPGRVHRGCCREGVSGESSLTLNTGRPGPAPRHVLPCRSSRSCSFALPGLRANGLHAGVGGHASPGTRHFGRRLREIRGRERMRAPGEGCCFGVPEPTRVRELGFCSAFFSRSGRHSLHLGHQRR